MIYLDNNATTRPSTKVCEAVRLVMEEFWFNPSSTHRAGQLARQKVELARAQIGALVGAKAREIIFTSGGTESIDLCIRGVVEGANTKNARRVLVTTKVEHAAVRDIAEQFEKEKTCEVRWLPLREGGVIDLAAAARIIDDKVLLVSVQWANNETGAIQPVEELAALCKRVGAMFHCDGTQWVGKEESRRRVGSGESANAGMVVGIGGVSFPRELGFDFLTFAPHKFHGPKGVGVLWARPGAVMKPQLLGSQELGRRGGTENVAGIVGAGVAAEEAIEWLAEPEGRERGRELRDRFEREVCVGVHEAVINGPRDTGARVWNTSNIGFPRLEAEALLIALSETEVCASAGAACSSGSLEPSPVLLAMGIPEDVAHGSLRFSLSRETTRDEIDNAVAAVIRAVHRVRESMAST